MKFRKKKRIASNFSFSQGTLPPRKLDDDQLFEYKSILTNIIFQIHSTTWEGIREEEIYLLREENVIALYLHIAYEKY